MEDRDMSEIPEAKSLRWLCNQFPVTIPAQDDGDRMMNAIHMYCEAGAKKIEELQAEVERLKKENIDYGIEKDLQG